MFFCSFREHTSTALGKRLQMLNLIIHVKAFFVTACLSPNLIINAFQHFPNFTYDPPQAVNRCYILLSFVQGLFVSIRNFILLTEMKQILFVC